jgi:ubiquinone/menaquinone biosynthesis C-methylase UbiE
MERHLVDARDLARSLSYIAGIESTPQRRRDEMRKSGTRRTARPGRAKPGRSVASFYAEMSSLDTIKWALSEHGLAPGTATARDLYSRGLDVQNLGGFTVLQSISRAVEECGGLKRGAPLLDVACGLGGPGRYLTDRYECRVTGIDLVPARVELARALAEMVGMGERVAYRAADATALPFEKGEFAEVWMLDASIHVRRKTKLFRELARVLSPGGLLVLHDMPGPLPRSMAVVTRRAPYHAPTLSQLIGHLEAAGFRLLNWRDTAPLVRADFEQKRMAVEKAGAAVSGKDVPVEARRRYESGRATLEAYLDAVGPKGPGCGFLIAQR